MEWRAIGGTGERYPKWLRDLNGKSGVYAIRRRGWFTTEVLYVGESHKGSLYKTLTRHFQQWNRGEKSRKRVQYFRPAFQFGQTDPGHTYERDSQIEVAFEVSTPAKAVELQSVWIDNLKPRDNRAGVEELEEAPF